MNKMLVAPLILFSGCANLSTTRFVYTDPAGPSVMVEMPKEMDAVDLKVQINSKEGTALLTANQISTRNKETIEAGARREANNIAAAGGVIEKAAEGVSEGAVKGAIKGIVP